MSHDPCQGCADLGGLDANLAWGRRWSFLLGTTRLRCEPKYAGGRYANPPRGAVRGTLYGCEELPRWAKGCHANCDSRTSKWSSPGGTIRVRGVPKLSWGRHVKRAFLWGRRWRSLGDTIHVKSIPKWAGDDMRSHLPPFPSPVPPPSTRRCPSLLSSLLLAVSSLSSCAAAHIRHRARGSDVARQ